MLCNNIERLDRNVEVLFLLGYSGKLLRKHSFLKMVNSRQNFGKRLQNRATLLLMIVKNRATVPQNVSKNLT
jgi:hypothetical protein